MAETNAKKAAGGPQSTETAQGADGQADAAGRNAASSAVSAAGTEGEARGVSAEGASPAGTHAEAAIQSGTDSLAIQAKSSTLENLDAEDKAALLNDVRTEEKRRMEEEVRTEGGDAAGSAERLKKIADRVSKAQRDLDEAMRKRDALRNEYDREVERQAVAGGRPHGALVADYFASADKQAQEDADFRRRLSALGLQKA